MCARCRAHSAAERQGEGERQHRVRVAAHFRNVSGAVAGLDTLLRRSTTRRIVKANPSRGEIKLINPAASATEEPKAFTYDHAYGPESTQKEVYDLTAAPIVGECWWRCCAKLHALRLLRVRSCAAGRGPRPCLPLCIR